MKTTRNRLRALRNSRGLTQKEVADALGIKQESVWKWENDGSLPRADKLPAIAKLFDCTVDDLFEEENA